VPGANAAISAATHGGFHRLSIQSPSPVFLWVKSGYLSFDYNKDPSQADQSFILHIPGTNVIIRTEKATLTFSISILHLLTFSSLLPLSQQCKGCERTSANLDHSTIATKREQQNWRQQDRWILTGLMLSYLLRSVIPPLRRIQKELPPPFLSLTYRDCKKTSFQNHIVWSHRSHREVLRLGQKVFNLLPMRFRSKTFGK
jgi:hypothetical protein